MFLIAGVPRNGSLAVHSVVLGVVGTLLFACGIVEERNLTATFPTAYPEYRNRTKMLTPFLLQRSYE